MSGLQSKAPRQKIMNTSFNKPELDASQILMDKQALADRYQVGVHTIERWQAAGIIDGERRGLRNYYQLEDSERRIWNNGKQKAVMKKNAPLPLDSQYVDKRTLAARYNVSHHTIAKWMNSGLLENAYFQVGYIIRFDVKACDAALKFYGSTNQPPAAN
jgi:hypothetical protein